MDKLKTDGFELMNVEEAAAYLHFSTTYLYRLARANMIPHTTFGRHVIFRKADLYDWIGSMVEGTTASFADEK